MPITERMVADLCAGLYEKALKTLPSDVMEALRKAEEKETEPIAKRIIASIIENVKMAEERDLVVCQDTGLPSYFFKIGTKSNIVGDLKKAIAEGTLKITQDLPLIPHCYHCITGFNPGTNLGERVPVVHFDIIPEAEYIEVTAAPIEGGGEFFNAFKNFRGLTRPDPIEFVKKFVIDTIASAGGRPCPPLIVGIGIGTSFDKVTMIAREASMRPLNIRHPDPFIRKIEDELLATINQLGIGPMGMGGDTTALAVNIETGHNGPCRPVAIKIQCWAARKASARIYSDGTVVYL